MLLGFSRTDESHSGDFLLLHNQNDDFINTGFLGYYKHNKKLN